MNIKISTKVAQDIDSVFSQFNRELFLALNPPLMPVKLERFDGCEKGDEVHLKLFWKLQWVSVIMDNGRNEKEIYFVDEGHTLPFFLNYWQHRHRIIREGEQSIIVDDITYRSPFRWLDYLLYPSLYAQFYYRRAIYRRFFAKKNKPTTDESIH